MPSTIPMDPSDTDVPMDGEDHHMQDANGFSANTLGNPSNGPLANSPDGFGDGDEDDEYAKEILIPIRGRRLLPTGVCYDDRMKLHANADWSSDKHHPEDPQRIEAIFNTFKRAGLIFMAGDEHLKEAYDRNSVKYMWRIICRKATKEEITAVHTTAQYAWAEALQAKSTDDLRDLTRQMDQGRASLYVGGMTFTAALLSAGGAIECCLKVMAGVCRNSFAIIRPPGHHAEFDESMGFCIFNNVPVAAKACQARFPETCRKILILDWDVHHGNGVQNIFYDDPNVLYISIHVYQNGQFYPGQPETQGIPDGGIENVGRDSGKGMNVNIGWHDQGMGDGEYMAAFQQIVMPIAKEFNPDLVIVSAGFDAADGDDLGGCFVTPNCYSHMTHMLMSLADGRVAVCLEGGYNLRAISLSALEVARTLMGEPPQQMELQKINKHAAAVLKKVQAAQAPYWECMRPGIVDVQDSMMHGGERMHDVIRRSQKQWLSEQFGMYPLFLQSSKLYMKMEDQVLVTPDFENAERLMVFIHDPPDFQGQPDPLDARIDPHNAFMTDLMPRYIQWSITQGFSVMDVNVPHAIATPDNFSATIPRQPTEALQDSMRDLTTYLWDNYLQLSPATSIFLVGIGDAYLSIKMLLISRPSSKSRITGILNFVTGALRPFKSESDPGLSSWYKDNSLVMVAHDHACWTDGGLVKKVQKRRFGAVTRSEVSGLAGMMECHLPEVEAWVMQRVGEGGQRRQGVGRQGGGAGAGGGAGQGIPFVGISSQASTIQGFNASQGGY